MRPFRTFLVIAALVIASACGSDDNDSPQGRSQLSVAIAYDSKGACIITPFDYPVELGDRTNWQVDVYVTRATGCSYAKLTAIAERVDGGSTANIDISGMNKFDTTSEGKHNLLKLIVAPGVFRFLLEGKPTPATITVTQHASSPPTTKAAQGPPAANAVN